jgi:hypothetical protein
LSGKETLYVRDIIRLRKEQSQGIDFAREVFMQLRNHPMMTHFGFSRWPPVWIDYHQLRESSLRGEVGVLRNARCYPYNHRQIFLTIEHHQGTKYTGCLYLDYETLGDSMLEFFKDCIGMTIEAIGSLEVTIELETPQQSSRRYG